MDVHQAAPSLHDCIAQPSASGLQVMHNARVTEHVSRIDVVRGHAGILRQNYRSHASLLSIPNRLFYGDQLLAAADQQELRPPQWAPLEPVQQESSLSPLVEEEAEEGEFLVARICC